MSGSRRLAAILAADVAGYSRLMGADEEGTLAALKAIRREVTDPAIGAHRGRIVKTTGDGLLVEFQSVVDAVRCAVAWQGAMAGRAGAGVRWRIGINLGDVIADEDDIFGDGVNVAARLEALAEPGSICLSRVVRDQVRDKLDLAFEDMGEQQVKNIARPVRVFAVRLGDAPAAAPTPQAPAPPLPGKPSIAVLPFQNMSGDPEQEYFADGMVEEIITALSRIRWLFVIARNSSFTYKGQAIDVKRAGRELGVRYVLEGSVRKGGNRVRITAQLIEAETGAHLWADRFDGSLEDVFELQDQVATSVAGAIEPTLHAAEARRATARPTDDLTAYDLYLRAFDPACAWDRESNRQALALLDKAIARDPGYGLALAAAAFCRSQQVWSGWAEDPETSRRTGTELARRAIQLAGNDPSVLNWAAGALANFGEEIEPLIGLIDRSLSLNPGSAIAWFWSGWIRLFAGEADRAIEHFETALRLDPRTPLRHFHLTGIGIAHFEAQRLDEAVAALSASLQVLPSYVTTYYFLASSLAHLARLDEAREVARRMRAITSMEIPAGRILRNPKQEERFLAGLRLALGERGR